MKLPEIDIVVETVCRGIQLIDDFQFDSNDAAHSANKTKPSGLVDEYIREYIDKSISARDNGSVALDSSGQRTGRVEKIITKVANKLHFEKTPKFTYKYASTQDADDQNETEPNEEDVTRAILMRLDEIDRRLSHIEEKINISEVKIVAAPVGLTHFQTALDEAKATNKQMRGECQ